MKSATKILLFIFLPSFLLHAQAPGAENLYEKYNNAVVRIYTYGENKTIQSQGSGVIVKSRGWIITNHHVISNAADIVIEHKGKYLRVDDIVADDPDMDIFIIHYSETDSGNKALKIPVLKLAEKKNIKIGQRIYAIGSPFDFENTITEGLISGLRKNSDSIRELIQVSSPISQGSSGGAILNAKGELVGISALVITGLTAQNLNFAIPIYDIVTLTTKTPSKITLEKRANFHFGLGNRDFSRGNYSSALSHFKKTMELEKENEQSTTDFYVGLGYSKINKTDSADYFFNHSITIENSKQYIIELGLAFYKQKLYSFALKSYEKALQYDSLSVTALIGASSSSFEMKQYAKSGEYIQRTLQQDYRNATAWYIAGNLSYLDNNPDTALIYFGIATGYNPLLARAWISMSDIYQQKGDTEKSKECSEKAFAIEPELKNRKRK